MKWAVVGLVVVGLLSAVAAAVLMAAIRSGGFGKLGPDAEATTEVSVATAGRDLPAMTVIGAGDVRTQTFQKKEAPEDYFSNPVQVIGKVLTVPVKDGQPFARKVFAAKSSGILLASALESGMRAFSISLTDYAALYGLLYPGSVVDVLASFKVGQGNEAMTLTLLRGVQVLGVEDQTVVSTPRDSEPKSLEGPRQVQKRWMVTLMVTPEQAQALQLMMEHGTLSLAMRNPLDTANEKAPTPTSLCALLGRSGTKSPVEVQGILKSWLGRTSRATAGSPPAEAAPKPTTVSSGSTSPDLTPSRETAPLETSPAAPTTNGALASNPETSEAVPSEAKVPRTWEVRIFRGAAASTAVFPISEDGTPGESPAEPTMVDSRSEGRS